MKRILNMMNNQSSLAKFKKIAAATALLIFSISAISAQDSLLVKGVIVNGLNKPLANVSVGIEGAFELPAVTNKDGKFTVVAASGSDWLNISPPDDYKKKRVFLNNRTELKIYLTPIELNQATIIWCFCRRIY